ncbi:MAG: ABC transporter ATP-binding protein [Proteobacteria bacterium]|nr:ABC transporter ATP-binding protein [Pseudomonadota bacterium]
MARPIGIELRGGALNYGGTPVFEELDLDIPVGRTTCLLGPSGVGKSSLLRLIAGISPEAEAQRLVASDGAPIAGRLAFMDQRDLLLPWLNVFDNVTLGARLRGETVDRHRAGLLLQRVGLADQAEMLPAALSGGMRQRAALARTLMEDRPVILMDEPFSALDALTRLRLQDLAAQLLAGRSALLVTHDPMEALRLGHRILVLSGDPARMGDPLEPLGEPPRPADDPILHGLAARILHDLAG